MFLEILSRFTQVFVSLFVIVEPFGVIPTFLALTASYTRPQANAVALKASVFGFAVLVFFTLFGNAFFSLLQIDIAAFKAAGGIILFLTAMEMMKGKSDHCRCSTAEKGSSSEGYDISFVPLGIPMLSGPGAITSVIVFSNETNQFSFWNVGILIVAIFFIFLLTFFVLRYSFPIKRVLGESGLVVMQRIMGLILAAVSLQIVAQGIYSFWGALQKIG